MVEDTRRCSLTSSTWALFKDTYCSQLTSIMIPKPRAGNNKLTQDSICVTWTLNLGDITPVLFSRPFSWMTIFPERWSSMISNSPMYPENSLVSVLVSWTRLRNGEGNVDSSVNSDPWFNRKSVELVMGGSQYFGTLKRRSSGGR